MAGTLAAYAHLILHSALAFSLRDSRSRAAVERIGITQTNEPQGDKHVEIKERFRGGRKNTKEKQKNKSAQ